MSYKTVAINAVNLIQEKKLSPNDAWQEAVKKEYPGSKSNQQKSCPRNAFLGLCSEGKVIGVRKDVYTNSKLNREYAMEALHILSVNEHDEFYVSELWEFVLKALGADIKKVHNSQMNVVMGLWENGFIKI
jgi:hypothetical protein